MQPSTTPSPGAKPSAVAIMPMVPPVWISRIDKVRTLRLCGRQRLPHRAGFHGNPFEAVAKQFARAPNGVGASGGNRNAYRGIFEFDAGGGWHGVHSMRAYKNFFISGVLVSVSSS
jgi:hypothetical protein